MRNTTGRQIHAFVYPNRIGNDLSDALCEAGHHGRQPFPRPPGRRRRQDLRHLDGRYARVDYITATTDNGAALIGEDLDIYGPPDKDILLIIGGTVTTGDSLKSDANGQGVTTTSTGDWVGALRWPPASAARPFPSD